MCLYELIEKLEVIRKLHGNLDVIFYNLEDYNLDETCIETILPMPEDKRLEITFQHTT